MITRMLHALTLCLALASGANAQDHPTHDGKVALFGTLHAHSALSGDVGSTHGLSPLDCFDHSRADAEIYWQAALGWRDAG